MTLARHIASWLWRLGFFLLLLLPPDLGDPGSWLLARRQLFNLIVALCLLAAAARLKPTSRLLARLGRVVERLGHFKGLRLPALLALAFFALACTLSGVLFSHLPHIPDSQLHYVAAKLLASGHLTAPAHPEQHLFPVQYLGVRDGMIYSSYPPGHTVFVALATLAGMPWITNPLMGACFVLAVYALGREAGTHATGLIAAALTLVCTFVVFMSSEFMSYATSLLFSTLFLLCYLRTRKHRSWQHAALAGACLGYCALIRPHCAALLVMFCALDALLSGWAGLKSRLRPDAFMAAAALPFLLFYLWYNAVTTGDPFTTGYQSVQRFDRGWISNAPRFFTTLNEFNRAVQQWGTLSFDFFSWPVPSFAFMTLLFACRRDNEAARRLGLFYATYLLGLMVFVVHDTQIFSARFLYEASGAALVLTALMLQRAPALARHWLAPNARRSTFTGALALMLLAFTLHGLYHRTATTYRHYSRSYYLGNANYARSILPAVATPALVFVDKFHYVSYTMPSSNADPVIFAQYYPDGMIPLMLRYPRRHVYRVGPLEKTLPPEEWDLYNSGGCLPGLVRYYIRKVR